MTNRVEEIEKLLVDLDASYSSGTDRGLSREAAASVANSALWAYSTRESSFASAYALMAIYEALGLKGWTFQDDEAGVLQRIWNAACGREEAIRRAVKAIGETHYEARKAREGSST